MSGAPTGWQVPKTDWNAADGPTQDDLNRWEGNSNAIETGNRTLDQALANPANVGTLRQIISWFAGRIKAITGKTNWYDSPDITLATTKQHIDGSNPHSGSASTTDLSTHANLTNPHSAASVATASRLILRDASGRAQVAAPSAAADIARKDTVDAHADLTNPHSAVSAATANRLVIRDADGRAQVATPAVAADIATKGYVDAVAVNASVASDVLRVSRDAITQIGHHTSSIIKMAEIRVFRSGSLRLRFDGRVEFSDRWGFIYLKKNALVSGDPNLSTHSVISTTWATLTVTTMDVLEGDLLSLWIHNGNMYGVQFRNFRLYYDLILQEGQVIL